jgi:hypothetical protein
VVALHSNWLPSYVSARNAFRCAEIACFNSWALFRVSLMFTWPSPSWPAFASWSRMAVRDRLEQSSVATKTESEIRDRIVGRWKLVSTEETLKNGSTRPFSAFGPHATGFLMYQRDGYMFALLANPERVKSANRERATIEEKLAATEGSFAYCGRYEIDVKQETIVHLPEVASHPGYVGSRQVRPYRFDGRRLIFSDAERDDPAVTRWKIVWEKVQ